MRILIIGAAGMVGSKLAASLAGDAASGVEAMTLVDMVEPTAPAGAGMPVGTGRLDITDATAVAEVIAAKPDVIFHLAAIVSGEAEADFDKLEHHGDFNMSSMSFSVAELADSIRKYIPDFEVSYEPDYRQAIADSWPQSIDDSAARKEWGWKPSFDLDSMTRDMLEKLGKRHEAGTLYR